MDAHAGGPLHVLRAFHRIHDRLATAGQPTADQFSLLRDAGFEAVLNLAVPSSEGALPNEPELVQALGMDHAHIPVDFDHPTDADVRRCLAWMDGQRGRRVLVHCALNMRASAMVFLWRVLHEGTPHDEALRDLHAIWVPQGPWADLLGRWIPGHNHPARTPPQPGHESH